MIYHFARHGYYFYLFFSITSDGNFLNDATFFWLGYFTIKPLIFYFLCNGFGNYLVSYVYDTVTFSLFCWKDRQPSLRRENSIHFCSRLSLFYKFSFYSTHILCELISIPIPLEYIVFIQVHDCVCVDQYSSRSQNVMRPLNLMVSGWCCQVVRNTLPAVEFYLLCHNNNAEQTSLMKKYDDTAQLVLYFFFRYDMK